MAVHASIRPEPFGLTIIEAMGCGKPVVVSEAGGAAELFTPDHDGLGHSPGDATGLASAIARLAADPALRARLGANARRTAVERFSQERYGREMAAIYAGFLPDAGRSGCGEPETVILLQHKIYLFMRSHKAAPAGAAFLMVDRASAQRTGCARKSPRRDVQAGRRSPRVAVVPRTGAPGPCSPSTGAGTSWRVQRSGCEMDHEESGLEVGAWLLRRASG